MSTSEDQSFRFRVVYEDPKGDVYFNQICTNYPDMKDRMRTDKWRRSLNRHYQHLGMKLLSIQYYEAIEIEVQVLEMLDEWRPDNVVPIRSTGKE